MYLFPGKDNSCLDNPFETMSSKRLNKIIQRKRSEETPLDYPDAMNT
jgi:hypothetical protein